MQAGTVLNQRYTITHRLGEGAMGEVYRAVDAQTGQAVAIKVIARAVALNEDMLARFKREAEALRQLKHPNIVGFVDAFEHEGQRFIVMEFVSGGSLHALLRHGPLPADRARHIALDLCDALIRAHRLEIIHRDLKPDNVLMTPEGTPKLTDFGVARLLSESKRLTGTGTQVGTPYYMSPEAWEGKPLDAQADIWSLGVMIYEMLTGKVPFEGDTIVAVMNQVVNSSPETLPLNHPNLPPDLAAILRKMLTRDKSQRYQTMRQVALELEQSGAPARTIVAAPPKRAQARWPTAGCVAGLIGVGLVAAALALGGGGLLWSRTLARPPATLTEVLAALPVVSATSTRAPTLPASTGAPTATSSPGATPLSGAPAAPSPTIAPPTATPAPTATPTEEALPTVDPKFTPVAGSTQFAPVDRAVLVFVPAGDFRMGTDATNNGNEKPEHWVSLNGYWIDRTEVTNAQFARFVAQTGYQTDAEKGGDGMIWAGSAWKRQPGANWQQPQGLDSSLTGLDNYPVTLVSWNDAVAYCKWAGRRLPTEAEWEKAARGRTALRYPWPSLAVAGDLLNFADKNLKASQSDSNVDDGYEFSAPVGHYPKGASPYGALDMAGNMQEWVADWYGDNYYQDPKASSLNPLGPDAGNQKVLRGGSWFSAAADVRTTARNRDNPDARYADYGFRCALSLAASP